MNYFDLTITNILSLAVSERKVDNQLAAQITHRLALSVGNVLGMLTAEERLELVHLAHAVQQDLARRNSQ